MTEKYYIYWINQLQRLLQGSHEYYIYYVIQSYVIWNINYIIIYPRWIYVNHTVSSTEQKRFLCRLLKSLHLNNEVCHTVPQFIKAEIC